jgi:hypothetical protein
MVGWLPVFPGVHGAGIDSTRSLALVRKTLTLEHHRFYSVKPYISRERTRASLNDNFE